MRILLYIFISLFIFSCGNGARDKRVLQSVPESNPLSTNYAYGLCGSISNEAGNGTGGSSGYFITSTNNQRFNIVPISPAAQTTLTQVPLNMQAAGCVYSNKQSQQGIEGMIIEAQEITL